LQFGALSARTRQIRTGRYRTPARAGGSSPDSRSIRTGRGGNSPSADPNGAANHSGASAAPPTHGDDASAGTPKGGDAASQDDASHDDASGVANSIQLIGPW